MIHIYEGGVTRFYEVTEENRPSLESTRNACAPRLDRGVVGGRREIRRRTYRKYRGRRRDSGTRVRDGKRRGIAHLITNSIKMNAS